MPTRLPAGPYRALRTPEGIDVPFYVIPFDKRGACEGPATRQHLLDHVAHEPCSDIFLFSHGWNNDWSTAIRRYEDFLNGYMHMRQARALPAPADYRPVLVGIFWPSTALVFTEQERGPDIASGRADAGDQAVGEERSEVRELADRFESAHVVEFYDLVQKPRLTDAEARRLATIAAPLYGIDDDELGSEPAASADDLVAIWQQLPGAEDELDDLVAAPSNRPAGILSALDPRQVVRVLTVLTMKDRAATVGASGAHELLRDLLAKSTARVHALGHSYGGKLVLSAVCAGTLSRPLHSMLLLQPAVSHLALATKVPDQTTPGGYHAAASRVVRPILSTFSQHDLPLTKLFHLAARRASDLGEMKIAARTGAPPSKYAALGGFGPRASGEQLIDILDPPSKYAIDSGPRVFGIDGSRSISGHGDISNEATWWALHNLVSQ